MGAVTPTFAGPVAVSGRRPHRTQQRPWLLRHDGVVALLVYLLVALFWYRGVLWHMYTHCACGVGIDPGDGSDSVWWFEWFVHALAHGISPLHTNVIWTPTGIDLSGTTASLLLAFVAAPFTLLWGPIVSFNLVMIAAPTISAWAANRLCRHISGAVWPSLLAGAMYGFSTYETAQLVGHPQMVVMFCPPLVALCVIRLLDGTLSPRRFVLQTTVLLLVQVFLSVEVLFTMTVVGIVVLAAHWITGSGSQRRRLEAALSVITVPPVIAAIASSWYLIQVLTAPAYASGAGAEYPTDALSFIVPMPYTWLGGSDLTSISMRFPGRWTETDAYLGLPLILILAHYLVTRRLTHTARVLTIVVAALLLWILGPVLWANGVPLIRLPYAALSGLPLFNQVMQGRIAAYLDLAVAVAIANWLAHGRRRQLLAWICALVALACVVPNLASPSENNVGTWTNPLFFRTAMYKRYLKPGETIMPINWGWSGESSMWQAEDHMYWKMANGYWILDPWQTWSNRLTLDLWLDETPHSGDWRLLRQLLVKRHVSDLVIQDGSRAQWQHVVSRAGLHLAVDIGGVSLYRVPRSWPTSGTGLSAGHRR
jgi:hypothetical protein